MSTPISGVFSDPTLSAVKLAIVASVARQSALASNIANANTPGFQRVDLSTDFSAQLTRAMRSLGRGESPVALPRPALAPDPTPRPTRLDGNNVNLDQELVALAQNNTLHEFAAEVLRRRYSGLRTAITGRSQ